MIDPQICTRCKTRNPIGNKFCRECGTALPIPDNPLIHEELERAEQERRQERVAGLLAEAFHLSENQEYAVALDKAKEAAEVLPDSVAALTTLASLYQRNGQRENAIAVLDRLIELEPEVLAHRAKREQVLQGKPLIAETVRESEEKPRPITWIPLAAAGVVSALVFGILMSLGGRGRNQAPAGNAAVPNMPINPAPMYYPPTTPGTPGTSGMVVNGANGVRIGYGQNLPAPVVTPYPADSLTPSPNPPATAPRPNTAVTRPNLGSTPSHAPGVLPLPGQAPPANESVAPVTLPPPPAGIGSSGYPVGAPMGNNGFGNGNRLPVGPPGSNSGSNPGTGEPPVTNPGSGGGMGTPAEPRRGDGGYIRIEVGPPAGSGSTRSSQSSGSPSEVSRSGAEGASLERARRLQAEGRYSEAVRAYRDALERGKRTGDVLLGMAQSYQRIGDTGAARGAYVEAIQAYEAQIAAGRSSISAQQGIATCRAAIQLIGGGG